MGNRSFRLRQARQPFEANTHTPLNHYYYVVDSQSQAHSRAWLDHISDKVESCVIHLLSPNFIRIRYGAVVVTTAYSNITATLLPDQVPI